MAYKMRVIVPKSLFKNLRAMDRAIENTLTGAALGAKEDFEATTRTWRRRPVFFIQKETRKRKVFTTNIIYFFLTWGTKVRYATMTPDFRAKTRTRYIGSNKGRGGLAFISKMKPMPGIKAREFVEEVGEKWDKKLPEIMQRAIDSEV